MRPETEAAIQAVSAALPVLKARPGASDSQPKARLDFVTGTDLAVEAVVIESLRRRFPEYGFLAEESGVSGSRQSFWVIDPICGTGNFAAGLPLFNVNVALVQDDQVVLGVLLDGTSGDVYVAERGQGASLNGEPIAVTDRGGIINFDFGHRPASGQVGTIIRAMEQVMTRRLWQARVLASSLTFGYLASGHLAGHLVDDIEPWDSNAGALIAEEAGATISDFAGRPWRWDSRQLVCGSTTKIHAQLLALVSGEPRPPGKRPGENRSGVRYQPRPVSGE